MAQGVITTTGRIKLCKAHAGDLTLPPIIEMAFGDGAIDQGNVIETTGKETSLYHELLRKTIESHIYPEEATARYTTRLEKNELVNASINEVGLYDSEGSLVAYKSFLPKGKDDDMEFEFNMDEVF